MSERERNFEPEQQQDESRFGDKEHAIEVMRSGEAHVIGLIDELYPDEIVAHQNVVEIIKSIAPKYAERDPSSNLTEPVMLHYGSENPMLCIFKPYDGENEKTKADHSISSFYPRELAAYMLSEHFGFDLIPPTTIREVKGRIGALQLFLEPPGYRSGERVLGTSSDEDWDKIQYSKDYQTIAAFDYILANTDRKDANMLVRLNEQGELFLEDDQPELIAIDHGLTLDTPTFQYYEIMGPMLGLTYDNLGRKAKDTKLPSELRSQIASGLERRQNIDFSLLPDIPAKEIEGIWRRAESLVDTGSFLSPNNINLFKK